MGLTVKRNYKCICRYYAGIMMQGKELEALNMLIIDEMSMVSKRTFEMLEYVLRLKDPGRRFGGIQVILVGDFMQLPPVRNKRCGDEGEICFTSSLFPPHSIILEEIMRQSDDQLIKCICELSKGNCSEDSLELLEQLSRPLSNNMAIKLYTTKLTPVHEITNNVVCGTSKASDQPAHTRSLIRAFASRLSIL